jgi:hypothetical protein
MHCPPRAGTRTGLANRPMLVPQVGQQRKGGFMATTDIWTYRDQNWTTSNFVGYSVEALDGSIGKIDEATMDAGSSYIVVDTGPWIFGKKDMLPAGVISRVDHEDEKVYVNRTKDQIKDAPEFDPDQYQGDSYRGQVGSYYGTGGAGWREW